MENLTLGNTGLVVSALGLGGIPLTRLSFDEAIALIRAALDAGINFIDTAHGYPDSEPRIGAAIAARQRSKLIIATKSPARQAHIFRRHVTESLQRLGTDYIDLVQFHNIAQPDELAETLAPGGAMEAAEEMRRQGLIRHIGVTTHSLDLAREMIALGRFETLQAPMNFLADDAEPLVEPCATAGIGLIAMKPFAGGMIEDATLAMTYLRQFANVAAIPGIETPAELEQLIQIYAQPARPPQADQLAAMAELRRTIGPTFCRACGYCQPCPQDIAITMVLRGRSFAKRMPAELTVRALDRHMKRVDQCLDCGQCRPKCPYDLDIPNLLRQSKQWYQQWRT